MLYPSSAAALLEELYYCGEKVDDETKMEGARNVGQRENLEVYVFGEGRQGQLGHGQYDTQPTPMLVETPSIGGRRKAIRQIGCGAVSSWVLLETGECLAWGELRGRLQNTVAVVPELAHLRVKQIAAGGSAIAILADRDEKKDDTGLLSVDSTPWGPSSVLEITYTERVKQLAVHNETQHLQRSKRLELLHDGTVLCNGASVPALPKSIISIAAGEGYNAALSNTGELYTWGIHTPPLGHKGPSNPINPWPERVLGVLKGKKVITMACGKNHMACVTDTGELYTWGSASHNQLGHGDGKDIQDPKRVQALQGKKVIACSCGDHHTACILDTGVLYTFGYGSRGALGHGEYKNEEFPRVVEALQDKMVRSVACGADHTICVVVSDINQSIGLLQDELTKLFELSNESPSGVEEASADVKLICGGDASAPPIYCHKVILSARCKEFDRQIVAACGDKGISADDGGIEENQNVGMNKEVTELVVWDIEYPVLLEVVRYLYSDGIPSCLGCGVLVGLTQAAARFELRGLYDKCMAFWEDSTTADNLQERLNFLKEMMGKVEQNIEEKTAVPKTDETLKALQAKLEEYADQKNVGSTKDSNKQPAPNESQASTEEAQEVEEKKEEPNDESKEKVEEKATEHVSTEVSETEKEQEKCEKETTNENKEEVEKHPDSVKAVPNSLSQDLEAFLNSPRYADILFSVEGHTIYAHKAILCSRSSHFKAMLTSGMKEAQSGKIEIGELSFDAFMTILQHLYTGRANITQENVVELLVTSNLYTIRQLQEQCESFIEGGIYKDNVTYLLEMAHRFQTHHLRCVAMNYLLQAKGDMTKLEGFAELSPEIIEEFKRGLTHGPSCTIEGAEGGFVGDTYHFVIVSRDAFGTQTTKEEEWDVKVIYMGEADEKPNEEPKAIESPEVEDDTSGEKKRKKETEEGDKEQGEPSIDLTSEAKSQEDAKKDLDEGAKGKEETMGPIPGEKQQPFTLTAFGLDSGRPELSSPFSGEKEAPEKTPSIFSPSSSTPFSFPVFGNTTPQSPTSSDFNPFSVPATTPSSSYTPSFFIPADSSDTNNNQPPAFGENPSSFAFSLDNLMGSSSSSSSSSSHRRTTRRGRRAAAPVPEAEKLERVPSQLLNDALEDVDAAEEDTNVPTETSTPPSDSVGGTPPQRARSKKAATVDTSDRLILKVARTRHWACLVCGKTDNQPDAAACQACTVPRGQKPAVPAGQEEIPVFVTASSPLHGDGTYMASFFPPKPGKYQINVKNGDVHIKDSPMIIIVENAVDTKKCTVAFEDGKSTYWTKAGLEVKAIIQAKDKHGNRVAVGGLSPSFEASVHLAPEKWTPYSWRKHVNALSANTPVHFSPSLAVLTPLDNKDGTYTVSFCVNGVGEYLLDITRKRTAKLKVPIAGVPLVIHSSPGDAWGPNCIAVGDDLNCAILERRASFKIIAKDRFNNVRDVGRDIFNVRIVRQGSVKMIRNELEEIEKKEAEELEKKKEARKKRNEERQAKGLPPEEADEEEKKEGEKEKEGSQALETNDSGEKEPTTPSTISSTGGKPKGKETEAERKLREEKEKKKKEKEEREKKMKEEWLKLEQDLERECLVRGEVQDLGTGVYEVSYVVPRDLGVTESYQLTITLKDGGLIRDAPFTLLVFEEGHSIETARAAAASATTTTTTTTTASPTLPLTDSSFTFGSSPAPSPAPAVKPPPVTATPTYGSVPAAKPPPSSFAPFAHLLHSTTTATPPVPTIVPPTTATPLPTTISTLTTPTSTNFSPSIMASIYEDLDATDSTADSFRFAPSFTFGAPTSTPSSSLVFNSSTPASTPFTLTPPTSTTSTTSTTSNTTTTTTTAETTVSFTFTPPKQD